MTSILFWLIILLACAKDGGARLNTEEESVGNSRQGRFNLFSIVKFPNDACIASTTKNGTCYTASECETRNGANGGSCAQGYGVCCTFTAGCGDTFAQNNTFFDGTGPDGTSSPTDGACAAKVCHCSNNICQMRLDFNTFVIAGPSTSTLSIGKVIEGELNALGDAACARGQCQTDTFSVVSPSVTPPVICGTNSGEHMYVDVSCTDCIDLAFALGQGATATRQWSIKVTQIACTDETLAPPGCTQYHYGSTTGTIQTYNFDNGQHLNNQRQQICIRNEAGMCRICYWHAADTDFGVSGAATAVGGVATKTKGFTSDKGCCNMGAAGNLQNGPDCVIIPGAVKTISANFAASTASNNMLGQFCGGNLVTIASGTIAATICTDRTPFTIMFASDNWEWAAPTATATALTECSEMQSGPGFRLQYEQMTC